MVGSTEICAHVARWASVPVLALSLAGTTCRSNSPADNFAEAIRGAEEVRLHEGLPHPMFEGDLLEAERRNKKVHHLHGYPFYEDTPQVSATDAAALTAALSEPKTFKTFASEKKCGGFHPDYALEWSRGGGRRYEALLCFGCEEVKLFGPGIETRHDLDAEAFEKLKGLLGGYRRSRPAK